MNLSEIINGMEVLRQKDMHNRPGFIQWDDSKDRVSFHMNPTPLQMAKSITNLIPIVSPESKDDFLNGLGEDAASGDLWKKAVCAGICVAIGFGIGRYWK